MTPHKKRIDFLAAEYGKVPVATFVRAVNDCHYRRNAGDYDAKPDIAHDAVLAWQRIIGCLTDALPDIGSYSIVDIGSGTGFVAERIMAGQLTVAKYIGYEPSEDMRKIAQMKHQDPRISFLPLDLALRTSDTISGIDGRKIVTMNSVLHHVVWWEEYLLDVVDCLNSGDLFVICHEPNSRFWENGRLVQAFDAIVEEKRNARLMAKFLIPLNYVRKLQKICGLDLLEGQVPVDSINRELKENGIIQKDLPQAMISAIIDYSVPLCWRNVTYDKAFDEGFFSIERLKSEYFQKWEIMQSFTYQHLAFSPSVVSGKWKMFDSDLAREFPDDGAQFCMVVKKQG